MTTGREMEIRPPEKLVVIQDRQAALQELETRFALAVKQRELLENYIKERLKPEKHFYTLPTLDDDPKRKPSLAKEGAEVICLPHGLKPRYQVLSGLEQPPLDDSPYQITVLCELVRDNAFEGQGIGSASSMVTRRDGQRVQRQKDPGLRHNATLKMAEKSAYIAATLNATAASEFFTQDLEEGQTDETKQSEQHWCSEHKTTFFKRGKMTSFAHPIEGTKSWCHEAKRKPPEPVSPEQVAQDMADLGYPPFEAPATEAQPAQTQQPVASAATGGSGAPSQLETKPAEAKPTALVGNGKLTLDSVTAQVNQLLDFHITELVAAINRKTGKKLLVSWQEIWQKSRLTPEEVLDLARQVAGKKPEGL